MSGFFPWNFRAGRSGGGLESTGCPLEDHPNWSIVAGSGPSNLCWDSMDGKSVLVNADTDDLINLAYRNTNMVSGSIAATIAMVSSSDQDWMLPLCARMINVNNLIGARWNDSQFEVVQRRVGTWSTLFAGGPVPAIGDHVVFLLSSRFWKLIVNGTVVGEGETTLADDPGYWGMSQHRSPGFVGQRLFSGFVVTDTSLAKTPCMTGPDTPYGVCSASSEFGVNYPAWKGMDCLTDDVADAWLSQALPMPQWIQWIGPAGQPAMVPDRLHVEARNMDATSNTDRGPESITLQGSNDNGQSWDDIQSWTGLDFGTTPIWDTAVTGANAYMAIRLQVDNIRDAGAYCQIGTFTVYGHTGAASLASVAFSGAVIERAADAVYISDIAAGGDTDDKAQLFSGTALQFDGLGTHVLTDNELVNGSDYTICCTVKFNTLSDFQGIVSHSFGGAGLIVNSYVLAARANGESEDVTITHERMEVGIDYRIIFSVKSEGAIILYVNRVKVAEDDMGAGNPTNDLTGFTTIMGAYDTPEYYLDGQLSNIQVWDAALNSADREYDFDNAHRAGLAYEREGTALTPANLKGFWPLIDGSGHIAHDHSGNANHGALVAFADDDSQWLNSLPSPLVPQSALMAWCLGTNFCKKNYTNGDWYISPGATKEIEDILSIDGNIRGIVKVTPASTGDNILLSTGFTTLAGDYWFGTFVKPTVDAQVIRLQMYTDGSTTVSEEFICSGTDWQYIQVSAPFVLNSDGIIFLYVFSDHVNGVAPLYIEYPTLTNGANNAIISINDTEPVIATNAIAPLDPWQIHGRFPRDFGELNWDGRGYSDAGDKGDVNPNTALLLEFIISATLQPATEFFFSSSCYRGYISGGDGRFFMELVTDGEIQYTRSNSECIDGNMHHFIYSFSSSDGSITLYQNGLLEEIDTPPVDTDLVPANGLFIPRETSSFGQLSLFVLYKDANAQEIIDGGLDAWVAELYQKRVDQGFVPISIENGGETVTHNSQPVTHRR